jgi:hypothetical protein
MHLDLCLHSFLLRDTPSDLIRHLLYQIIVIVQITKPTVGILATLYSHLMAQLHFAHCPLVLLNLDQSCVCEVVDQEQQES